MTADEARALDDEQLEGALRAALRDRRRRDDVETLRGEVARRYKSLLGLPTWLMEPGRDDFR